MTVEELCGSDFPAIEQQGRLDLLGAYDALDEEGRITLLRVAKSLAAQVVKKADPDDPAAAKPVAVACIAKFPVKKGHRP